MGPGFTVRQCSSPTLLMSESGLSFQSLGISRITSCSKASRYLSENESSKGVLSFHTLAFNQLLQPLGRRLEQWMLREHTPESFSLVDYHAWLMVAPAHEIAEPYKLWHKCS